MARRPCSDLKICSRWQEAHLQTIIEVLQSIKASEMTPLLNRIYGSEGGGELLDVLMKYLYGANPSLRQPTPKFLCC